MTDKFKSFLGHYQERLAIKSEYAPVIIKYPFWQMTAANPRAMYACVNYGEATCPKDIEEQSICLNGDIGEVICDILK